MTVTLTEFPNVEALKQVIELPFIDKGDKPALEAYLKLAESNDGAVNIHYSQRHYNGNPYGRYYPDLKVKGQSVRTAQAQWRHVRSALFAETETDIDIVNCHPTILSNICKVNRISSPHLDSYVADRDKFITDNIRLTQEDVDRFNDSTTNVWTMKDLAKAVVSATLYGCGDFKKVFKIPRSPFRDTKFKLEIKRITKALTSLPKYTQLVSDIKVSHPDAHDGTFMSFILQEEERKVVESAMNLFIENGFTITALIHDGFHVLSTDKAGIDSILQLINSEVAPLRFIRKPFAKSALTLHFDEPEKTDMFLALNDEFNATHAKIIKKSIFVETDPTGDYTLYSQKDLTISYADMCYTDSAGKTQNFIKHWLTNNPNQRKFDNIGCFPPGVPCPDSWFNTWKPFAALRLVAKRNTDEEIQFILNHIRILCNHDEKVYDYFIKWIAQWIQFPSVKSTCITLISEQGAGKGTLLHLFGRIAGADRIFSTSSPSRDVWGDFNGLMANAFIVNLDELSKAETTAAEGKILKLITDPMLTINNKGVNPYEINSYHRFIVTTNNEDPIKTSKGDRRNLIIRSSDEKCPTVCGPELSSAYFSTLRKYIDDDDCLANLFNYFKGIQGVDKFNSIPIPKTEHQENLKELSKTPVEQWLEDFVARAHSYESNELQMSSTEVYDDFCSWSSKYNKDYKVTNVAFAVRLKNLKINGITTGIHTRAGKQTLFELDKLRVWVAPPDNASPLGSCRV